MAQASVEEGRRGNRPDRNLALELVRVTEAAALAAGRWVGRQLADLVSPATFRQLVIGLLLLTGASGALGAILSLT